MRALGRRELPDRFRLNDRIYRCTLRVKHDFWAATGFYENDAGHRVVLKASRTEDFAGIPLAIVGRWLCRREQRFYNKLSDLPNVPKIVGRLGDYGFIHEYVPGKPLSADRPVPDGFFDQLVELLVELHQRGVAYADTNKPENILLGDDGRPHLIDFQISYDTYELFDTPLNRWVVRQIQKEDLYHILKHKKRLRFDEMSPAELEAAERRSVWIRLHRTLTLPYFRFRRRLFQRLRASGRLLPEGSK